MTATTAPDPARADLMASLEKRNATFSTLIRLIPSQYYVAPTDEEMDTRWMKNKKRKTGEEIKEHKRRAREEKVSSVCLGNQAVVRSSSWNLTLSSTPPICRRLMMKARRQSPLSYPHLLVASHPLCQPSPLSLLLHQSPTFETVCEASWTTLRRTVESTRRTPTPRAGRRSRLRVGSAEARLGITAAGREKRQGGRRGRSRRPRLPK